MANNNQNQQQAGKTTSGTNVQHVKQQNQQAAQGQYGTEFASETDAQHVKKYNQQAEANKSKNS
ncbi:gamma-type small acid-soluble spore protein [Bacillus mangrovi]|uniref:Small, acid-soluble spore protein gamma-type n=1 Tax=Metabacillus mangrovi TaxID=1491830 RepID=A0A7X2V6G7_9BACI|nr:gamma-type small acid-soluble spore protein [Metabacillus mangrovi]MTH55470.1 gamma-type small acid-soluble spore protein [Metabacillus mangrovi]